MKIQVFATITLTVVGFALLPKTEAVSPPPDGGYAGFNAAEGQNALLSLTTGVANTAVGWFSLENNTAGNLNTAIGAGTLLFNVGDPSTFAGIENTAVGAGALLSNTTGSHNTANGVLALFSNSTGIDNTAIGEQALFSNTTGGSNTATGFSALAWNVDGIDNTADGESALGHNTSGGFNTAVGVFALLTNTDGSSNTAVGQGALGGASGNNSTALGYQAAGNVTTADNVICIGANVAGANVSDTCFIGNIRDVTTQNADAIAVVIDSAGQLGTMSSSCRFKEEIKPMDDASEAILALKPVTFHYKRDKTSTPQFGLIAEEVAKINPNLVVRDKKGEIYTVRYDAVNAMLLNEFLKEHRRVEELQSAMAQQRKDFETALAQQHKATQALVARLDEHEAQIQKVSAQIELGNSGSKMLVENH
jgi:hypothetical protein